MKLNELNSDTPEQCFDSIRVGEQLFSCELPAGHTGDYHQTECMDNAARYTVTVMWSSTRRAVKTEIEPLRDTYNRAARVLRANNLRLVTGS